MDQGHIETEKLLVALEKRIEKVYGDASKEMQKKADAYFAQFVQRDKHQQDLLKTGKITEQEYKQWRLAQMGRGERFIALRDDLAKRMTEANKVAAAYINDETPSIYSLNHNYAAYEIEKVSGNVGFTLYDEQTVKRLIEQEPNLMPKRRVNAPKDLKWNKKRFQAEITAGILQGESIGHIANRVQNLSDANRSGAIRNARTAVTGAQNAGRQASYDRAKEMDLPLRKRWIATKDNRTRHAHAMLDGQTVALDKPFKVEGQELMFPGDPTGRANLVWNCRCTVRTVEKEGIKAEPRQMRVRNPETGRNELISDMSYAEWAGWKNAQVQKDSEKAVSDNKITTTEMQIFDSIRNKKRENLVVYDDNGKVVHRETGTKNHTGREDFDYRGLHAAHNHPAGVGYYPSGQDLVTFHNSGAKSMTVVSPDHTIKFIRTKNVVDDFYTLSSEAAVSNAQVYGLQYPFGTMSPQQYRQKHGLTMKEINEMRAEYELERIKRIMEEAGYKAIIL